MDSTIRVGKLTVLAKVDVVRLEDLAGADRGALAEMLRRAFSWDD